ncbi:MAG: type IV pilus secretin PilQ [candidate division Zixibacteria bacterium]|nr:type IV pilus secretin PilQ [candidate division Zixibacteria bacterium]
MGKLKIKKYGGVPLFLAILALIMTVSVSGQEKTEQPGNDRMMKSLSLSNADIQAVLTYLGEFGGTNIVAAPSVQGNISLKLRDVTWRKALDIIMETYGFTAVEGPEYITVMPTDEYQEKLAKQDKFLYDRRLRKDVHTKIVRIRYASAAMLEVPIKTVLSERGNIDTDKRTNSLIIRDIPEYIARAESLITSLDTETRQIKISAQLLEVETRYFHEVGFDWSVVSRTKIDKPDYEVDPDEDIITPEYGVSQNTSGSVIEKATSFQFSKIVDDDFNVDVLVDAIVSSNKGRILGHPEIITVDNLEAKIQMGQKIPIKQFDEAGNVTTKFYDVGIQLRVVPHITAEDRILMELHPERSDYSFDANGIVINTQNANTNVVVDNGQTVVIGGLTSQEDRDIQTGIPILKDIPLLGYLFRYTKKETKSRDLVIFVTPQIVSKEMALESKYDTGQP